MPIAPESTDSASLTSTVLICLDGTLMAFERRCPCHNRDFDICSIRLSVRTVFDIAWHLAMHAESAITVIRMLLSHVLRIQIDLLTSLSTYCGTVALTDFLNQSGPFSRGVASRAPCPNSKMMAMTEANGQKQRTARRYVTKGPWLSVRGGEEDRSKRQSGAECYPEGLHRDLGHSNLCCYTSFFQHIGPTRQTPSWVDAWTWARIFQCALSTIVTPQMVITTEAPYSTYG